MASAPLTFAGRVALITGAGGGLGRLYALQFAARGASVVVNDLGGDMKGSGGTSARPADAVVEEIQQLGGKAVANYDSVEDGDKVVKTALDHFGRIDILVNNAGILRDKSFGRMTDNDWDLIHRVHLRGSYKVTRAAWDAMKKQQFGRIIMISSVAGIYGNFGQANYSAAKLGLVGLSNTLAKEGAKYNIKCNAVAPTAGSRLLQTVMPQNMIDALKPDYIAPLVLYLCHEDTEETGELYETAAGLVQQTRWQKSAGVQVTERDASGNVTMTPEMVRDMWDQITDFEKDPLYLKDSSEGSGTLMDCLAYLNGERDQPVNREKADMKDWTYTERDVMLYNLGVGVKVGQPGHMRYLFEGSEDFSAIPTFPVNVLFNASNLHLNKETTGIDVDPSKILHGEMYIELYKPVPTSGTLSNKSQIVDVVDKGSGALILTNLTSFDEDGEKVSFSQSATFVVGAGGFGGNRSSDRAVRVGRKPSRACDRFADFQTNESQAALYRLSGDRNPLHIDPNFAALGGFDQPILHGLCTMGIACRQILEVYGGNNSDNFKSMKVRFSNPVLPGQTIRTEMWRNGNRIDFQSKVVENDSVAISGGFLELHRVEEGKARL